MARAHKENAPIDKGTILSSRPPARPEGCNAAIVLASGEVFWGRGAGAHGVAVGEVCFNTALTGYQETLTDPSYAGQIITFTFPHIGNVGTNIQDIETDKPAVRGCILRADISEPANWRAGQHLDAWLKENELVAITGIDTRALTRRIRDGGAPNGAIIHLSQDEAVDINPAALRIMAKDWPSLEGQDLAEEVTCEQPYNWDESRSALGTGYGKQNKPSFNVVAVDFGAKKNILRCLASAGCSVTVVPASTSADEILKLKPHGVFLSNGPGDPGKSVV